MVRTHRKRVIGLTLAAAGAATLLNVFLLSVGVEAPTVIVVLADQFGFSQGALFQTILSAAILTVFLPAALFIGFPWTWKFVFLPIVRALTRHSARVRCSSTDPY